MERIGFIGLGITRGPMAANLDRKAPGMLRRDFQPGFRIDLHHNAMGIVTSAAREAGVVIPLVAHVGAAPRSPA